MDFTFPYTQSYKKIPDFFKSIQNAAVPSKFTYKVLANTFDLKGPNDRALVALLKSLGFIDGTGIPTQKYSDYKNPSNSEIILGECMKSCYGVLYQKNEKFHELPDDEISGIFASTTGKDSSNKALIQMIKTFLELKKISKFDESVHVVEESHMISNKTSTPSEQRPKDYVLTHTIVVNLPATTDKKVYDTLFKSMKENLL